MTASAACRSWCPDLVIQRVQVPRTIAARVTGPARVAQTAEQRTRNCAASAGDLP
jgi:hypothetical protein